ncbi:MAG: hypothetical protein ABL952_10740, partial [Pyrinomonadaceae bacterium]
MKKTFLSLFIVGVMLIGGTIQADAKPVTKEERKAAVKYLKHTQKLFKDAVKGLSEKQLKW